MKSVWGVGSFWRVGIGVLCTGWRKIAGSFSCIRGSMLICVNLLKSLNL